MKLVIDTSAIVAVLRTEDDAGRIAEVLGQAEERIMTSASYLEAGIVMANDKTPDGSERLQRLMLSLDIRVADFTQAEAEEGIMAHRRFGRGSGHPAKLNFGDCLAYALARTRNLPLLFKGEDFIHTDIVPALKPA